MYKRMSFKIEALQCPCAALLNFERHCWKRHDPTNVSDRICVSFLVREACQVAFNPIMPGNKRGSAGKPNISIWCNQTATGESGECLEREETKSNDSCNQRDEKLFS